MVVKFEKMISGKFVKFRKIEYEETENLQCDIDFANSWDFMQHVFTS